MQLITALATPYRQCKVDYKSFERLLERQTSADVLLCCGTTAEGAFLTAEERKNLISAAKLCTKNAKIWVGISNGVTKEALKEACAAQRCGAEALLVSPPAFFKCTPEGFTKHLIALKNATGLPLVLYNAPSRCGYILWQSTLKKLAESGIATMLKDAGSDPCYTAEAARFQKVFCGNEEMLKSFVGAGCRGVVSVLSNVFPQSTKNVARFYAQTAPNATENAESAAFRAAVKLAFCQINPIAVKYMLYKQGIFESFEMRLPLTAASPATQKAIDDFWQSPQFCHLK